jgi:hypothetical protein
MGWTRQTLTALAILTVRPGTALTHALPGLRPLASLDIKPTAPTTSTTLRVACQHCTASKDIPGLVSQRADSHEHRCPRRHRWRHGPEQHALHALPEICTANRRHRRRHDDATLNTALTQARNVIRDWLAAEDQPRLQQRWTQRLNDSGTTLPPTPIDPATTASSWPHTRKRSSSQQ